MRFTDAVDSQTTQTENGMKTFVSSLNANVDMFFKFGALRGQDIKSTFSKAYAENPEIATRIALWGRDAREGAGERQLFRDVLKYLEKTDKDTLFMIIPMIPEIGRWDDVLIFEDTNVKNYVYGMIKDALLVDEDGLCAKWQPRPKNSVIAVELAKFMGMSLKAYRKLLVRLTKVVETQMCNKEFDSINFSQVPSVAHARYRKAFYKNAEDKYTAYVESLKKGTDPKVKINAGAVYPYDVVRELFKALRSNRGSYSFYGYQNDCSIKMSQTELDSVIAQWDALPNYMGDANVLPLVDVSGSMDSTIGNTSLTCMEVAVSLGLYCADKNVGKFKDMFVTFSGESEVLKLTGNIKQKFEQMLSSKWGMNTNLNLAFDKILKIAIEGNVPQNEMPEVLLVLSDMEFDQSVSRGYSESAQQMIERKYADAGYKMPKVVYWNIQSRNSNVPVRYDKSGAALVSGFSPAIVKSILAANLEEFTPVSIMMKTIMNDRYSFK